jgi:hypothetical protein
MTSSTNEEQPGRDQHPLVGQLALELERHERDDAGPREAEQRALDHGRGVGGELERLQEQDGSKPSR